jgi:hypothetical protein
MIRSLAIAITAACVATIGAWFIIPASTYIENALGIIMLVFSITAISVLVMHRLYLSKRK